ncbi:MAG: SUMF1/EgtB/PvdO family nonheme iron enzyme [Rhodospirillaceae bacterium]|nr:SUMF1/EgtB/PvdO family nonheme iron enzyme [Rhodospirillaceae bacterium]
MADGANTARRLRMGMAAAVPTLAVVMSVPIAVAAINGAAVQQETAVTVAARAPAAVEASLGLDRPARRLIQQGFRNEGFDPGTPDGLFGPRTRAAIQDWQQSCGASLTGYLNGPEAELLRTASAPPPAASGAYRRHQLPPDVNASALSAAATRASTAEGTDSNPAPATVAAEVDPRNAATTKESRAATASGNSQLPPEIMVDRLLVWVDRLLAENDPGAAFEAMNEILALQEEHDLQLRNDLPFRYARVAFAAGQTETAIASLNEYLVAAGREGEFYRQALELLDAADVRLQEEERAARWPVGYVFRDCDVCPTMVVMPERRLALGRYEVTVGEYRAFAAATAGGAGGGCDASLFVTPDSWRDPGHPQTDRHPVTCVSWDDAQEYASWLSPETGAEYRLPSETEWARAAAGSQPGCYFDRTDTRGTYPVGSYGRNPAGLSDMVSNVAEWTSDCWQGDCGRRVQRGNAWGSSASLQSADRRYGATATRRWASTGFRVARVLD